MENQDALQLSKMNAIVSSLKFKFKILESNYLNFLDDTISIFTSNKIALEQSVTDQSEITHIIQRIDKNLDYFEQTKNEANSTLKGLFGTGQLRDVNSIVNSQLIQTEEELVDIVEQNNEAGVVKQAFETVYDCFKDLIQWHKYEKTSLIKKWKQKLTESKESNRQLIKGYTAIIKGKHEEYRVATAKSILKNTTPEKKLGRLNSAGVKVDKPPLCRTKSVDTGRNLNNRVKNSARHGSRIHSSMDKAEEVSSEYIKNANSQLSSLLEQLRREGKENQHLRQLNEKSEKYMHKTINTLQNKLSYLVGGIKSYMLTNANMRNEQSTHQDTLLFQEEKMKLEYKIHEVQKDLPKGKETQRINAKYKNTGEYLFAIETADNKELDALKIELDMEKLLREQMEIEYLAKFENMRQRIEILNSGTTNSLKSENNELAKENEELRGKLPEKSQTDCFQKIANWVSTQMVSIENEVKTRFHTTEKGIENVLNHIDQLRSNMTALKGA